MNLVPVIMSGGRGTRLWPVSRELHPKPFIRLADGQSLLQKAFLRASALPDVGEIITVTNRDLFFKTADEYREVLRQGPNQGYILEPVGRNTAPAIAAAALSVLETQGPDAVLLVLTADHLVSDLPAFQAAVAEAVTLAGTGRVVAFGIHPTSPESGYGYIEAEGNDVLRFVEKPSTETARQYLASGRFLWNSGMFCATAATLLAELQQHAPELLAAVKTSVAEATVTRNARQFQLELDADSFARVPDISFDYALMEKTDRAAVVPCSIGWSDVGSWDAIGDLAPPDASGNRIDGEALLQDTRNCYIRSQRLVGAVGVNDLIIVDTADALLVANRNRVQDVKLIVERLKIADHDAHKLHRTVHRPWGTYTTLEEGKGFKIKRIEVTPGQSLSLQLHHHRSEHWVVVDGTAEVTNGDTVLTLQANQSTYIPSGCKHRLANPGKLPLVLIEVQSGDYLGEDDIVRFEDVYGRC